MAPEVFALGLDLALIRLAEVETDILWTAMI